MSPTDSAVVVTNYVNGHYLSTNNQTETPGQQVQIWDADPMANRGSGSIWEVHDNQDGTYLIRTHRISSTSQVCLTTAASNPTQWPGNTLWVQTCDGSASQDWIIRTGAVTGTYVISPTLFPNYVVEPYRGLTSDNLFVSLVRSWPGGANDPYAPPAVAHWRIAPLVS